MTRKLLFILLVLSASAFANQSAQGYCALGGQQVTTAGLLSTSKVIASYPSCTVTVLIHGGGAATIYSDNANTPLSNPFTATSQGYWQFYAANGHYDITISGGGMPSPFTYSDIVLSDNSVSPFPGADIGAQINNCLLVQTVCDATNFVGTFTNATNPVAGLGAKSFTLLLGQTTINDSSCWLFSNDGASPPAQGVRRILGAGTDAATITAGKTPTSGTIINNSCNSGVAKFDTRGAGVMEVSGITFMDSTGDALPFWQTTNTILKFHDNQIYGSKNGILNNQDGILLGSTTTNIDGSSTAAFQGYGTYIERNIFNHIRRVVYGRTFANNVFVQRNTVWVQSGSNLVGGAAIEFDASAGTSDSGNVVRDNLLEVTNYPYGVKFSSKGFNNTVAGTGCFDPSGTHLACARFESTSSFNLVEDGYRNDSFAGISEDVGSALTNTFITAHQLQFSNYTQPVQFTSAGAGSPVASVRQNIGGVNLPLWNSRITTTNDEFYWGISTASQPAYNMWIYPAGGAGEEMFSFRRYDANQRGLFCFAATTCYLEAQADLRMRAAAGANTWLGTNTTPDILLIGDSLLKANQHLIFKTDNTFDIGAVGATRPRTLYLATSLCLAAGTCFTGQSGTGGTVAMTAAPSFTGTTNFSGQINSTIATGTAPLAVASTTPVSNLTVVNHPKMLSCGGANPCAMSAQASAFAVYDGGADYVLAGGTLTVTGFPFTANNTFGCMAIDQTTGGNKVVASNNSGSSVTFNGTASDHFRFVCNGN